MVNCIEQGGQIQYNVVSLAVDTEADMVNLSTKYAPGSTAFVIETSAAYMLNGSYIWEELK